MYHKQIAKKTSPSFSSKPINQQTIPTPSYGSLSGTIQRAVANPESLSQDETLQLDSAIGTRATNEIMSRQQTSYVPEFQGISAQLKGDSGGRDAPIQRQENDNVNQSQAQPENESSRMPEFISISAQLQGDSGLVSEPIQAKLTIGQPNDKYEKEADRVASQVVNKINTPGSTQSPQGESVQRQGIPQDEEIQTKPEITSLQCQGAIAGGETSTSLTSAINSARGGGQPLDGSLQQSMGQAMGADFSGVRVHTNAHSDRLNQSLQAKAFTTGKDVFFQQGAYQPGSRGGQELIAHELTHVVQQTGESLQRMQEPTPGIAMAGEVAEGSEDKVYLNDLSNNPGDSPIVQRVLEPSAIKYRVNAETNERTIDDKKTERKAIERLLHKINDDIKSEELARKIVFWAIQDPEVHTIKSLRVIYNQIMEEAIRRTDNEAPNYSALQDIFVSEKNNNDREEIHKIHAQIKNNKRNDLQVVFRGCNGYQALRILNNNTAGGTDQPNRRRLPLKPPEALAKLQTGMATKSLHGIKWEEWSLQENTRGFSVGGAYLIATVRVEKTRNALISRGEAGVDMWDFTTLENVAIEQMGEEPRKNITFHVNRIVAEKLAPPPEEKYTFEDMVQVLTEDLEFWPGEEPKNRGQQNLQYMD